MGTMSDSGTNLYRDAYNNGRLAGMREVAEWIKKNSEVYRYENLDYECKWLDGERSFIDEEWQAKLKEWRILNGQN